MINNTKKERPVLLKLFVYFWIFIIPWNISNSIMGIFSIIIIIWWLVIGKKNNYFTKLKEIRFNLPLMLLFIFILYSYMSIFWTDNFKFGIEVLNFYKYYWVIIPIIFTVLNKDDIKIAFYILTTTFGFYAIFSILIFIGLVEIKGTNSSDPKGILAYALVTVYMAINTLFALYFYLKEKNIWIKYLMLFISIISFFGLIINNGRIAQISFLCTIIILSIFYRKTLMKYKYIVLSSIFGIILGFYLLYSTDKLNRYIIGFNEIKLSKSNQFEGSWGHRLYMWYAATDAIAKYPVFGNGVGDTIDEFIEYGKENPSKATWLRSYHNQHLDYLTKYGIVGYFIFLSSIFILLRLLYKDNKYFFVIGLMFFSIVLIDCFGDIILLMKPFNNIYVLVFVLLAIVIQNNSKYRI